MILMVDKEQSIHDELITIKDCCGAIKLGSSSSCKYRQDMMETFSEAPLLWGICSYMACKMPYRSLYDMSVWFVVRSMHLNIKGGTTHLHLHVPFIIVHNLLLPDNYNYFKRHCIWDTFIIYSYLALYFRTMTLCLYLLSEANRHLTKSNAAVVE